MSIPKPFQRSITDAQAFLGQNVSDSLVSAFRGH